MSVFFIKLYYMYVQFNIACTAMLKYFHVANGEIDRQITF